MKIKENYLNKLLNAWFYTVGDMIIAGDRRAVIGIPECKLVSSGRGDSRRGGGRGRGGARGAWGVRKPWGLKEEQ